LPLFTVAAKINLSSAFPAFIRANVAKKVAFRLLDVILYSDMLRAFFVTCLIVQAEENLSLRLAGDAV